MAIPQVSSYGSLADRSISPTTYSEDDGPETPSVLLQPLLSSSSNSSSNQTTMSGYKVGSQGAIMLLCCINLLNYVDRGIIPGAPEEFESFITDTLRVSVLRQSVFFGLLTSAFIASYSVFSVLFGFFALTHRPFRIIALGMSVWIVAVVICGAAQVSESYYVLITGRLISGVGEASFQCTATPFINRFAPPQKRSLYLGIYLASITVGTAVGYIYGSIFARSAFGWAGAYYLEGVLMVGLVVSCLVIIPDELNQVPMKMERNELENTQSELLAMPSFAGENEKASVTAYLEEKERPMPIMTPSFFTEWWRICSCFPFLLIILGHSAYTFSMAAMSTFSPDIFIGLGLFEDETTVSLIFGGLVAITGTIGTPVGGILVDYFARKKPYEIGRRCMISVKALFYLMLASVVFGLTMVAFVGNRIACLFFLTLTLFCTCALSVPETIAVLELFPKSRQSMAVAANTLFIHALGDVPSPIILGLIKDDWAPLCGTVEVDGEAMLNPRCSENYSGLRNVLLFAVAWMSWGVLLWGASVVVIRRRLREEKRRAAHIGIIVDSTV